MKPEKGYQKLQVWTEAHKLVLTIYKLTENFPKSELLALTSQMRRSAVSIPGNIVEGHAKRSQKDFLRFLNTSNGSLVELEYYLELSPDLGYIKRSEYEEVEQQQVIVGNLLNGLMKSIRSKIT
ncbi:MAG: four helix bundle protein [Candidatus Curtissbacteria bacterium]|nr:four helix bundle protein [Candidatus Curtissbacteria bacterium]